MNPDIDKIIEDLEKLRLAMAAIADFIENYSKPPERETPKEE